MIPLEAKVTFTSNGRAYIGILKARRGNDVTVHVRRTPWSTRNDVWLLSDRDIKPL